MSNNIVEKCEHYLRRFSATLSFIGVTWIMIMMVVVVIDVIGRYFFNSPLTGTAEIARNSIVGIAFFMLPWATVENRHIRTTIIVDSMPDKWKRIQNIATYILGLFVFIEIINSGWTPTIKSWILLEYEGEGALRVPTYPIRTIILLGSILTSWHLFYKLIKSFQTKSK